MQSGICKSKSVTKLSVVLILIVPFVIIAASQPARSTEAAQTSHNGVMATYELSDGSKLDILCHEGMIITALLPKENSTGLTPAIGSGDIAIHVKSFAAANKICQ